MATSLDTSARIAAVYQTAPQTRWAVEKHGSVLYNQKAGTISFLQDPQAALWDLLSRQYRYDQIVCMLCAITSFQADDVETLIIESLESWTQSGFLIIEKNHGESFDYHGMQ